jgi:hypothetical protein
VKPAIQQITAQCLAVHLSLAFEPIESGEPNGLFEIGHAGR